MYKVGKTSSQNAIYEVYTAMKIQVVSFSPLFFTYFNVPTGYYIFIQNDIINPINKNYFISAFRMV